MGRGHTLRDWEFTVRLTARTKPAQGPAVKKFTSLVVAESAEEARETVLRNFGPRSATVGFWEVEVLEVKEFHRPKFNFWENQKMATAPTPAPVEPAEPKSEAQRRYELLDRYGIDGETL